MVENQRAAKLKRINKQKQEVQRQYIDTLENDQVEDLRAIGVLQTLPQAANGEVIDIDTTYD